MIIKTEYVCVFSALKTINKHLAQQHTYLHYLPDSRQCKNHMIMSEHNTAL